MLACIDEAVCLQEIDHPVLDDRLKHFSWDGGQTAGFVVPRVREETLFWDEAKMQKNVLGIFLQSCVI